MFVKAALVKAGLCSPGRLQGCCTCSQGHCCCRTAAAAGAAGCQAAGAGRLLLATGAGAARARCVMLVLSVPLPSCLPFFRLSSTRSRTAPSEHDAVGCMTLARACLCHVPCLVLRPCEHQCSAHPPFLPRTPRACDNLCAGRVCARCKPQSAARSSSRASGWV